MTDRSPLAPDSGPAHDVDVEVSVLGGILYDASAMPRILEWLDPAIFHNPAHRIICRAMMGLHAKNAPVDLATVFDVLLRSNELESIGGAHYLSLLTKGIVHTSNIEYHCCLLVDMAVRREAVHIGQRLQTEAGSGRVDHAEAIESATNLLRKLSERSVSQPSLPIASGFTDVLDQIMLQAQSKDLMTGVSTGFKYLNRMTSGWQKGNLVILAARPAMGKTAFMLALVRTAAVAKDIPTQIYSLEMTGDELRKRMAIAESGLDNSLIQAGIFSSEDRQRLMDSTGKLMNAPIYINEKAGLSIAELQADARRMKSKRSIGLICVDYLQLMAGGDSKNGRNREQEISEISRGLKNIAKELEVPVIALSQLSREVEKRPDKKPRLSDLRESGSLEQDADLVLFLHRPEYYGIMTDADGYSTAALCEILVSKQRNGAVGEGKLTFTGSTGKFYDRD